MDVLLALAVGYYVGARAGSRDVDQVRRALKALRESEEFRDLVAAVRSHAAHTLRELATMVEQDSPPADEGTTSGDLVARVRQLFGG